MQFLQLGNQRSMEMQMSSNHQKIEIFNTLQQHYMLIYIQNIQEFELEDIQGLALSLERKLLLDQKQKDINEKLQSMSKENCQKKKMSRKKKNDSILTSSFSNFNSQNQSFSSYFQHAEQLSIEESFAYPNGVLNQTWTQLRKFVGIIFDGNLMIKLPLKYKEKYYQNIMFQVKGQHKKSSISSATMKMLKLDQKVDKITLEVAQKQQQFNVNSESNILGLDFLHKHKVILECNYRPQVNKFTLTFTS